MSMFTSLHVGYVLKRFPRLSETFVLNELLQLQRLGAWVTVFALGRPDEVASHAALEELDAEVLYAPRATGPSSRRVEAWGAWVAAEATARGVGHLHAHFATSATETAWEASRRSAIPFSFTAHAKDIYHEAVDLDWMRRAIEASAFTVTVSDANREYLARVAGAAQGRLCRIYNGVDVNRISFASTFGRRSHAVLAVGRLVEKKGFADLIDALALLREGGQPATLTLVGAGELEHELRARVAAAGLDAAVSFTGPLPQESVLGLMRSHTVFALPCLVAADGNRDALPTVILESMASGLPVVSTDVNGVPEMISDGVSGRIVPQRSPSCLAGALDTLLSSPTLRTSMAGRARDVVASRFRLDASVTELATRFADASERQVPVAEIVARPQAGA